MIKQPLYDVKEALKETTGKVGDFTYPAHTYYLANSGKLLGFTSCIDGETRWFTKTLSFDKRRRKFEKVTFEYDA